MSRGGIGDGLAAVWRALPDAGVEKVMRYIFGWPKLFLALCVEISVRDFREMCLESSCHLSNGSSLGNGVE